MHFLHVFLYLLDVLLGEFNGNQSFIASLWFWHTAMLIVTATVVVAIWVIFICLVLKVLKWTLLFISIVIVILIRFKLTISMRLQMLLLFLPTIMRLLTLLTLSVLLTIAVHVIFITSCVFMFLLLLITVLTIVIFGEIELFLKQLLEGTDAGFRIQVTKPRTTAATTHIILIVITIILIVIGVYLLQLRLLLMITRTLL